MDDEVAKDPNNSSLFKQFQNASHSYQQYLEKDQTTLNNTNAQHELYFLFKKILLSPIAACYTTLHPEWDYPQVHVDYENLLFVQH